MKNWNDLKTRLTSIDDLGKEAIAETAKKVNECVRLRMQLGVTQMELAEFSGLTLSDVALTETSHSVPDYNTVMKMLTTLMDIKKAQEER